MVRRRERSRRGPVGSWRGRIHDRLDLGQPLAAELGFERQQLANVAGEREQFVVDRLRHAASWPCTRAAVNRFG